MMLFLFLLAVAVVCYIAWQRIRYNRMVTYWILKYAELDSKRLNQIRDYDRVVEDLKEWVKIETRQEPAIGQALHQRIKERMRTLYEQQKETR